MIVIGPISKYNNDFMFDVIMDPPLNVSYYCGMISNIVSAIPNIGGHRCINDDNLLVIEELSCGMVPHLLEHVIVELHRPFMHICGAVGGLTEWDWRDGHNFGTFKMSISAINRSFIPVAIHSGIEIINASTCESAVEDIRDIMMKSEKVAKMILASPILCSD